MDIKPILFNTEMVQAIQADRKTQTRRIIKPQPSNPRWNNIGWLGWDDGHGYQIVAPCSPGDILWVRETWHKDAGRYMYRADYGKDEKFYRSGKEVEIRWTPSIHMPKEAARIFLKVKNVWAHRLQDIEAEEIRAEGIEPEAAEHVGQEFARGMFHDLWDSTIKPADLNIYGWPADPWVWVIEFERCERPEGWPT